MVIFLYCLFVHWDLSFSEKRATRSSKHFSNSKARVLFQDQLMKQEESEVSCMACYNTLYVLTDIGKRQSSLSLCIFFFLNTKKTKKWNTRKMY